MLLQRNLEQFFFFTIINIFLNLLFSPLMKFIYYIKICFIISFSVYFPFFMPRRLSFQGIIYHYFFNSVSYFLFRHNCVNIGFPLFCFPYLSSPLYYFHLLFYLFCIIFFNIFIFILVCMCVYMCLCLFICGIWEK